MSQSLRERLYRTDAIVLQIRDLGEADRILVVFTPTRGKVSIIAKGARRTKSRLGPYLDHFSQVALHLSKGRDLDVVTSAVTIRQHVNLSSDIDAFGHAAHCAELVRDLTEEHQEHPGVFELLASSLTLLDEGVNPWHVARHFELGLLVALGYRPELFHCLNCQRDLDPCPNVFSSRMGGMLCDDCNRMDPSGVLLSVNAQKYLRTLARSGLGAVVKLDPDTSERQQINQAMMAYLHHVGERDFTSLRVLSAMQTATRPRETPA
jgi:DNA repair protein RecO (recombination protein O)